MAFLLSVLILFLGLVFPTNTFAIGNTVGLSTLTYPNPPSNLRPVVSTSEGTLHYFMQVGTNSVDCGGSSYSGLLWYTSIDQGSSWSCRGQLSDDTTNQFFGSAAIDSSDNVYVTYSVTASTANAAYDIYYRRLTKGAGATWTLGAAQKVMDSDGTVGYSLSYVEVEDTTRLWLSFRIFDGTNYTTHLYYGNQADAPTWNVAKSPLSGTSVSTSAGYSSIHVSGDIIYALCNSGGLMVHIKSKSTAPDAWINSFDTLLSPIPNFSAVADDHQNLFIVAPEFTGIKMNVITPHGPLSGGSSTIFPGQNYIVPYSTSLSTDGSSVWLSVIDSSLGYHSDIPGKGVIKRAKVYIPAENSNVVYEETITSDWSVFDSFWSYKSSVYLNDTVDAGDIGTANDVQGVQNAGDILYLGKNTKFDSASWSVGNSATRDTVAWEYWNGSDWQAVSINSISTSVLGSDGYITFVEPADWQKTSVNSEVESYYYLRARVTTSFAASPVISFNQFVSAPAFSGIITPPRIFNSQSYTFWVEGTLSQTRLKSSTSIITTASTSPSEYQSINPPTAIYSVGSGYPLFNSRSRSLIKTSDGTFHLFLTNNGISPFFLCNGNSTTGLVWVTSTDGATFVCRQLLSTTADYVSAVSDANDNIYLAYDYIDGTSYLSKVYYRKLTKTSGSNWTVGAERSIFPAIAADDYYEETKIAVDPTNNRLWFSTSFGDYANDTYKVMVFYSNDMSDNPTLTESAPNFSLTGEYENNYPAMVRYGNDHMAIIYGDDSDNLQMRTRSDTDDLATWTVATTLPTTNSLDTSNLTYSAIGSSTGKIFASWKSITTGAPIVFSYYNGTSWSSPINLIETPCTDADPILSMSASGDTIWLITKDSMCLPVLMKGVYPYEASNFETIENGAYGRSFRPNKLWTYIGGIFTDNTAEALSVAADDFVVGGTVGDMFYYGQTEKFDALRSKKTTTILGGVGSIIWEYWNGSAWKIINTVFETATPQLRGINGFFSFIPHTDWQKTSVNGEGEEYYYIRGRTAVNYISQITLNYINSTPGVDAGVLANNVYDGQIYSLWGEKSGAINPIGSERVRLASYDSTGGAEPTPTPTPTPTLTPTPTPTVAVENSSSSQNSSSSSSSPSTPVCGDPKPASAPDLFRVDASINSAKLFFTPISNTSRFYVSFSTKHQAEEHGEEVELIREGVQSHTIYQLKPNTTYYIKVRGQIGCMPGDWSGVMKIKTNSNRYYKNVSAPTHFDSVKSSQVSTDTVPTISNQAPTSVLSEPTQVQKQAIASPTSPAGQKLNLWQKIVGLFKR